MNQIVCWDLPPFVRQSVFSYCVSVFLIVGNPPSYIAQYVNILGRKSSKGISWFSILLAAIALSCNMLAICIRDWKLFNCCSSIGFGACTSQLLPMIQIGVGWFCTCLLYVMTVYFAEPIKSLEFDQSEYTPLTSKGEENAPLGTGRTKGMWISFGLWAMIFLAVTPAVTALLIIKYGYSSEVVSHIWSQILAAISISAILMQWIPQMYAIWSRKSGGNLSLIFLGLQTFGCFVVVFSLWFQNNEPWWIYGPYLVEASQVAIVFFQCIYYKIKGDTEDKGIN